MEYIIHFALEAVGAAIGVFAYRFCQHDWHRWTIWFVLSAITTIVTVQLVG